MRGDAIRGERRLFVNYPYGITGFASSIRESCRASDFHVSLSNLARSRSTSPSGDRISETIFFDLISLESTG